MSDQDARRSLSEAYVVGRGVEVGALHNPLWTSETTSVRYVDRLDVPALRLQYPELNDFDLVAVDLVDDGETLSKIADGELDFVIANHMIEHAENPLNTIRSHLRKVRPGGILYYAVPDKRFTFDHERPITPFKHLVRDDREGPHVSRLDHFREWGRLVGKIVDPALLESHVNDLLRINYSIHFHVWDYDSFVAFLDEASRYLDGAFTMKRLERNGAEVIVILEKLGRPR